MYIQETNFTIRSISYFAYNDTLNKWEQKEPSDKETRAHFSSKVKIGTLNSLHNRTIAPMEYFFIRSQQRYQYQVEQLFPEENFDVLGLNEVTLDGILPKLMESQWIQERYFLSEVCSVNEEKSECHALQDTVSRSSHGCLLLSRLPVMSMYAIDVHPRREETNVQVDPFLYREAVCGVFRLNRDASVAVVSAHLRAYQGEQWRATRRRQLTELNNALQVIVRHEKSEHDHVKLEAVILMGDLNLHDEKIEDEMLDECGFKDLYTPRSSYTNGDREDDEDEDDDNDNNDDKDNDNDDEERYTWDYQTNAFLVRYIPHEFFRKRRMRLDRITVLKHIKNNSNNNNNNNNNIINQQSSSSSSNWKFTNVSRFADKQIPEEYAHGYVLWPSDHYGLKVLLQNH